MKPTFSRSASIDKHRAVLVLLIPSCLQSPPGETKAPTRPERKAVAATAVLVEARMIMLSSLICRREQRRNRGSPTLRLPHPPSGFARWMRSDNRYTTHYSSHVSFRRPPRVRRSAVQI